MDQRTLVGHAQRGDHDAFATLVRERIVRLDAAARLILSVRIADGLSYLIDPATGAETLLPWLGS